MSKTAQRIAREQADQPVFYISDDSFESGVCKVEPHKTIVIGSLVEEGTYNILMPSPSECPGQVCAIAVYSETEDAGVTINLQANGTNLVSTVTSPDGVNAVLFSDGLYWNVIYNMAAETSVGLKLLPAGGTTGQVLAKASDDNFDVAWIDLT